MYRYAIYKGYESKDAPIDKTKCSGFADHIYINDWAENAFAWAVNKGIISGKAGVALDPQGMATRAECAAILHRFDTLQVD